ncbi:hypothetical protein MHI57_24720 [Cytobacillus sp. FSL K6-0129]|uniref:hypothetical protein n=1 Tax=Cytobacillus sp. FSL K6-0129 TaxID=2921421 RepID=UPI0030F86B4A
MKYLASLVVTFLLWMVKSFVFMKFFNWFPSQIFEISTITFLQSFVLLYTFALMRFKRNFDDPEERPLSKELFHSLAYAITLLIILFIGWLFVPYV